LAVGCLNLFVALALVSVSLLLGLAVSIVALLCDRARATDPTQARTEGSEVTPTLLFARRVIIQWVTFWVTPFEFTFDLIETELDRRGVDLSKGQ
jgi:hypothetical protein